MSKATRLVLVILLSLSLLLIPACGDSGEETAEPATPAVVETPPAVEPPPEETAELPSAAEPPPEETVELPPVVEAEPEPALESDRDIKNKSFIWQVSSDVSFVYLLGSIHVASFALYPLDSCIKDTFEQADNLAVEVNINEMDSESVGMLTLKYALYSDNETLQNNIPEELYIQLGEYFAQYGIDMANLDIFKPWFVYLTLDTLMKAELGYHPEYGIDLYFLTKAADADKEIIELETAEFQIELLSSLTDEMVILILEESLRDPLTKEDVANIFEAWENGDAVEMEQILFEGLAEEPTLKPFYDKMFDERNFDMAEKIEGFLADDETYFVVVGAGHLVGENGLINILDERGYTTEQLYDLD